MAEKEDRFLDSINKEKSDSDLSGVLKIFTWQFWMIIGLLVFISTMLFLLLIKS